MKHILSLLFLGWIFSGCCNDDVSPIVPENSITVLIVDETSNSFEGGKIYTYQNNYPTYNLQVENRPPADAGYIKVHYVEGNEQLYYASQIWMGMGKIIVPSPLTPPHDFERTLTNDYVFLPDDAVELTNGPSDKEEVEKYWAQIQGLKVVREALKQNNGHVHYFVQLLGAGLTDTNKWVFIVKN